MDKYTGKRLDGRYEIHELVGVGGMAQVYRAYDILDQRTVAIKILKDEFLHNAEFIRRFKNESKAIALLSHPNIIKVFDVSFGDQIQYIVEEFIDGVTLRAYLDRKPAPDWREALHFTAEILGALQHAHERGIVHRDIKPQNIMVLPDGHIKVTDFGIARFARSETRTMTDKAIGSVHYIAPEQARGDITDEKADIYSVGVMLYEMCTGQLPFEAENAVSVAIMQLQNDPRPPREINPALPQGLQEITLTAMQKDPARRYPSAARMLQDVRAISENPQLRFDYGRVADESPTRYVEAAPTVEEPVYDDNYEYTGDGVGQGPQQEKPPRSKAPFIITGIAAAFLVVAIVLGVTGVFRSCGTTPDVRLDDFVGRMLTDVQAQNLPFRFDIQEDTGSDKPAGTILSQDPKGGTMVKQGSTVTLVVAQVAQQVPMPDLRGKTQEEAQAALRDAGLTPEFQEEDSDTVEAGKVVRTQPAAGAQVSRGATVVLYLSSGALRLPDVAGQALDQAKAALEQAGFQVRTEAKDNTGKSKNMVVSTNPAPGTLMHKGDQVTIVYSSGRNQSSINVVVSLPRGVDHDIALTAYLNGERVQKATVKPSYNDTWTGTFTGLGKQTLTIELDGKNFATYTLDFDTNNYVQTGTNPYKDPQTSSAGTSVPPQSRPSSSRRSSSAAPQPGTSSSAGEDRD